MYLKNMPVAAGAKEARATYHSHTADAARRDDCRMVRLKVPGFALATISTGDPAFRFEGSSPKRTMDRQTQRRARERMQSLWEPLGSKPREVGGWYCNSDSWVLPDGEVAAG